MNEKWPIICTITDKDILGTEGLSDAPPKRKSRAILINEDGQIAVMYEAASNFYALPGGGIEPGEDETAALRREIEEETGCVCDSIQPLGIVRENRFHAGTTHESFFFVVHTIHHSTTLHLTSEEVALGTLVNWCSLETALQLIDKNRLDSPQKRFLRQRDLNVLNYFTQKTTE